MKEFRHGKESSVLYFYNHGIIDSLNNYIRKE